jgi:hypothetical protein
LFSSRVRGVAAVVAVAALVLSACGGGDEPPPETTTTTTTTETTPPPSNLTFSGVSVNDIVEDFEGVVEIDYDVKYVAADGDPAECPDDSETSIQGSEAQMTLCGDMKTLVVPEYTDFGDNAPRVGVWFFVVKQLAGSLDGFDEVSTECAAGYVIQRAPKAGFVAEDMALLKDYLVGYDNGSSMYEAALYGINFSQKNAPISTCAPPSQGSDRETP